MKATLTPTSGPEGGGRSSVPGNCSVEKALAAGCHRPDATAVPLRSSNNPRMAALQNVELRRRHAQSADFQQCGIQKGRISIEETLVAISSFSSSPVIAGRCLGCSAACDEVCVLHLPIAGLATVHRRTAAATEPHQQRRIATLSHPQLAKHIRLNPCRHVNEVRNVEDASACWWGQVACRRIQVCLPTLTQHPTWCYV